MPRTASRLVVLALALFLGACASKSGRPLPKYEKPIARASIQRVRTTAYTHSEADHIKHGKKNALGTTLQARRMRSAAADWSRWPAGTIFRIVETGEIYRVDDYGWALAGTNTIDLYKPSRSAMNKWGVRHVTIQNIIWGDVDASLAILRGRSKYAHVRRMIEGIESRYAELKKPLAPPRPLVADATPASTPPAATPVQMRTVRAEPVVPRAELVNARPALAVRDRASGTRRDVALTPFQAGR